MYKSTVTPVVVIPNLNGGEELIAAVQSLVEQSLPPHIIVVDNASSDNSIELLQNKYPDIEIIRHSKNKGYAGGVNPGFRRAIALGATYTAPFNNDAIADRNWLKRLVAYLDDHPRAGVAASKVLAADRERIDSTGEFYTIWGLAYPRGRREYDTQRYDNQTEIFGASGASSLYRVSALKKVGLLDEDFFAYYEDVDLSFRLQLAGWKIAFVPNSIVYHKIGMTGDRVKGFYTRQTIKNLPLIWFKNIPSRYLWHVGWRLALAETLFFGRAVARGQGWTALKAACKGWYLLIRKIPERRRIQEAKKVSDAYIWHSMVHDLPPNAHALRQLRSIWWRVRRRQA